MNPKSAIAAWDGWVAAQHFEANRSVPDREMLEALLDCESLVLKPSVSGRSAHSSEDKE